MRSRIVVTGNAPTWQDALMQCHRRLRGYLRGCWKGNPDADELTQEAIGVVCRYVAANWKPGTDLPVQLRFTVAFVNAGGGMTKAHRRRPARSAGMALAKRVKAKEVQMDLQIDFRLAVEQLSPLEQKMIDMLLRRCRWDEIEAELETNVFQVHRARLRLRQLLRDYA